jgi:hydrogen peroxide-dependent heme synthase
MSAESENPAAGSAGGATQPMQHGHRPASATQVPATLRPPEGWHVLHVFYRIDRAVQASLPATERLKGRDELLAALEPSAGARPEQIQCFAVPGHKADFGVMIAGSDLKQIHAVQIAIQSSALGPAISASYSFYSITEVSEYVPGAAEYGRILREREGMDPDSPAYKTKVDSYARRLEPMNQQRLYPEFPNWPCLCFYPMSKMRQADQNWYLLPFETRAELMSQHGRSGMKFAGKVTQLITASTGLDDWEWGVTLWARNPAYLKDIVYAMRFDESSAKYALFGSFYFGYILPPLELLDAALL